MEDIRRQTKPIDNDQEFLRISDWITRLLAPYGRSKVEYKGSHSWQRKGLETEVKLAHYGPGDCVFGIREGLLSEALKVRCSQRFPLPPNWYVPFAGRRVSGLDSSLKWIQEFIEDWQDHISRDRSI